MDKVKVWWDQEGDFLEVIFDQKAGYFVGTETEQLMKKVDMGGRVIGFSVLSVSQLKKWPSPTEFELNPEEISVERIFRQAGAVLEGHFLLTSGLHSPAYWEKMRVLQHPGFTEVLCRPIARHFRERGVQAVAGPALGGVVLAFEVARQLGVRAVYAEEVGEERFFRQGLTLLPGERVLIVDDVLTTGGSVRQMVRAVAKTGAEVMGIGVIIDRRSKEEDLGFPLFACHRVVVPAYRPEECPLCQAGIPLLRPGGKR